MILKMVLGLMQSILSFVLGLLPLPDVPAWLVELTETILGYMKTGMGIVLFFVPQAVVQGALDLVILVTSWLCGFFVKSLCLALNRKTPAGPRIFLLFLPEALILYWQKSPFRKGAIKGVRGPFYGVRERIRAVQNPRKVITGVLVTRSV